MKEVDKERRCALQKEDAVTQSRASCSVCSSTWRGLIVSTAHPSGLDWPTWSRTWMTSELFVWQKWWLSIPKCTSLCVCHHLDSFSCRGRPPPADCKLHFIHPTNRQRETRFRRFCVYLWICAELRLLVSESCVCVHVFNRRCSWTLHAHQALWKQEQSDIWSWTFVK